jgi:NADH-quinone oxidoreductase subunit L
MCTQEQRMSHPPVVDIAVRVCLLAPASLVLFLGLPALMQRPLREAVVGRLTRAFMLVVFLGALTALVGYVADATPRTLSYGNWFSFGSVGFSFDFLIDGWSLGFATLAAAICGLVAAFSNRYLHREPGYHRYFILFALFVTGIMLIALAGSIEVLFAGWELVGVSSVLLIGFFHERRAPMQNALRVFAVYRMSDAAMLTAAVLLHHFAGSGSLALLFSGETASSYPALSSGQATLIAVLLIAAVAGKSALLPFSGWLPRAMEGPTPSSAVYYGSLSIHAGCFLLLRAGPLLEYSTVARVLAGAAGASTALYAALTARVQADIKSSLAYAALTQVGVIVVEIALGLYTLAFIHIIGHACFRLLQFLSAPNLLHDLHELESALSDQDQPAVPAEASETDGRWGRARRTLYLVALERGFVDALLDRFVVLPFRWLAHRLDQLDRWLCGFGDTGRAPGPPEPSRGAHDD